MHLITVEKSNHIVASWLETNNPALSLLPYKGCGFFVGHNDGSCVYRSIDDLDSMVKLALSGADGDPIYDICCDNKFIYTACRDACVRRYSPDSYITRHFNGKAQSWGRDLGSDFVNINANSSVIWEFKLRLEVKLLHNNYVLRKIIQVVCELIHSWVWW